MWAHTTSFWQASIEALLCARLYIVQGIEIYKNKRQPPIFLEKTDI